MSGQEMLNDFLMDHVDQMARWALDSGESVEDVAEAVFVHIFNSHGLEPELKEWAMGRSDSVMRRVIDDRSSQESSVHYVKYLVEDVIAPAMGALHAQDINLAKRLLADGLERIAERGITS